MVRRRDIAFGYAQVAGLQLVLRRLQQMRGEQRNVVVRVRATVLLYRKHVEPEIKVLVGNGSRRTACLRSRLVAAIDARTSTIARAFLADAFELALLQHAQRLALQLERDLADLVEEQRAAIGQLEAADRGRARAPVNGAAGRGRRTRSRTASRGIAPRS